MKAITFALVIALLLGVSLSFAGDEIAAYVTFGTWINSDYNDKGQPAKVIVNLDGTMKFFPAETDTIPWCQGTYTVTNHWHDRRGNLWIKYSYNPTGYGTKYFLSKYSDSGKVWELVWMEARYPDEMSPIGGNYGIYYRQK